MYNKRESKESFTEHRFGKEYKHKKADHYECSTYVFNKQRFINACSGHYIRSSVIRELVLKTIDRISSHVRENETEFVAKVREMSMVQQTETANSHKNQLSKNERRIAELGLLFRKTYEDNAGGKLNDKRFVQKVSAMLPSNSDLTI